MNLPQPTNREKTFGNRAWMAVNPIITAGEASKLVGVSRTTIARWIRENSELGYYDKRTRSFHIKRKALLDFVEKKMVTKHLKNCPVKVLPPRQARGVTTQYGRVKGSKHRAKKDPTAKAAFMKRLR